MAAVISAVLRFTSTLVRRMRMRCESVKPTHSGSATVMFNPEIVKCSGPYEAEEGCLSLAGTRKAKRYRSIKVQYQNECFETRLKTYTGFTAQIIQHEIDHLGGVLI